MEWNFVDQNNSTFFRILLQAKQAYGNGAYWTRHCYRELFHKSGKVPKLQAEVLCETSRRNPATYPLYIFYHPKHSCLSAQNAGYASVSGVNIASGYLIEKLAVTATTRKLRTANKSLGKIAPSLFPLTSLFCPATIIPAGIFAFTPRTRAMPLYVERVGGKSVIGFPLPPTPRDVRDRLAKMHSSIAETYQDLFSGIPDDIPQIGRSIPQEIQAIIDNRGQGKVERNELNRRRITFVSASSGETKTVG